MEEILEFLKVGVSIPYMIFIFVVFMYCIYKSISYVYQFMSGLLLTHYDKDICNSKDDLSFIIVFFAIIIGFVMFVVPFYIIVRLFGNFFHVILVIIGIWCLIKHLRYVR